MPLSIAVRLLFLATVPAHLSFAQNVSAIPDSSSNSSTLACAAETLALSFNPELLQVRIRLNEEPASYISDYCDSDSVRCTREPSQDATDNFIQVCTEDVGGKYERVYGTINCDIELGPSPRLTQVYNVLGDYCVAGSCGEDFINELVNDALVESAADLQEDLNSTAGVRYAACGAGDTRASRDVSPSSGSCVYAFSATLAASVLAGIIALLL